MNLNFSKYKKEIGQDLNQIVDSDLFAKGIVDFETNFSHVFLTFLSKIISQMSDGFSDTKIGNVLYRFFDFILKFNSKFLFIKTFLVFKIKIGL